MKDNNSDYDITSELKYNKQFKIKARIAAIKKYLPKIVVDVDPSIFYGNS